MPTVLTRDQIRTAQDISIEFVPTPLWSKDDPEAGMYIMGLTGTERDEFDIAMIEQRSVNTAKGKRQRQQINLRNLRAKLIVRTAVDSDDPETARHIFEASDIEWLGKKAAQALQPLYDKAMELSGLSESDIEELTDELEADPKDASGSGSLLPSGIEASPNANGGSAAMSSLNGWPMTDLSPSETADSTS